MADKKKPEPTEVRPKILRAFKPGDIVFLECPRPLTADQLTHIHAQFKKLVPDVRIVVLPHGLKVAAREEVPSDITVPQLPEQS